MQGYPGRARVGSVTVPSGFHRAPSRAAAVAATAAALVSLLFVPAAAGRSAGIDFRSGFDAGTIAPWEGAQVEYDRPLGDSIRIVSSPRRTGTGAAMFVLRQGYSPFGYNESAELCCGPTPRPAEGSDYWYAWSTMFGTPWYGPYKWGIFAQWHSDYGLPPPLDFNVGVAAISVQLHTGAVSLENGGSWEYERTFRLLNDVSAGQWHDFVVHVHWSAYRRGSVTVWHRLAGEPRLVRLLRIRNVPTLQRLGTEVSPVYAKIGLYRASYCSQPTQLGCTSPLGVQHDTIVFQDDFRRSTVVFPGCTVCRKG